VKVRLARATFLIGVARRKRRYRGRIGDPDQGAVGMLLKPAAECDRAGDLVTLVSLFSSFLKVSLCGFGGGLVWARRVVVEQRQWMDEQQFAETLTLCQLMPGPNIVGITVSVGAKLRGPLGALTAVAGFVLLPLAIGLTLGSIVLQRSQLPVLQNVLGGLSAAAAGLLIGTGLRLLKPHRRRPTAILLAALAFLGMAFTRLPLPIVLLALAPLGIFLTALERSQP
jgi:chromate transporter